MAALFDKTVILSAPPHTRGRYFGWVASERVRAGVLAAIVIVVPGAWAVALVWYAVRRRRAEADEARP